MLRAPGGGRLREGSTIGRTRIGLSGWNYDSWRGDFYPEDLPRTRHLAHVADVFDTVEVNGSFYSLLQPSTYRRWYDAVPAGFRFAVKGSRFITHNKKLRDVDSALANFFASGVLDLREKLGPFLWQLSAQLRFDADRIGSFLSSLPRDTDQAADLARRHDDRVGEPSFGPGERHRIRHVLEVRNDTWLCDELVSLARAHGVALAFSHSSAWPYVEEITAGFVYLRLHGPGELYASPYRGPALDRWAARVEAWRSGGEPDDPERITDRSPPERKERDVYVYFDNDDGGHAPRDAVQLRERI